jgi:2-polyprenyl-6-methoxyphenol hydroxylase-like FAD-dependent oxidoreductase
MPSRLTAGRVCLVGDAAHLPSPMTGSGFSASAEDALSLADALVDTVDSSDSAHGFAAGLARYEAVRLDAARQLVRSGQSFSRSFAPRGAAH